MSLSKYQTHCMKYFFEGIGYILALFIEEISLRTQPVMDMIFCRQGNRAGDSKHLVWILRAGLWQSTSRAFLSTFSFPTLPPSLPTFSTRNPCSEVVSVTDPGLSGLAPEALGFLPSFHRVSYAGLSCACVLEHLSSQHLPTVFSLRQRLTFLYWQPWYWLTSRLERREGSHSVRLEEKSVDCWEVVEEGDLTGQAKMGCYMVHGGYAPWPVKSLSSHIILQEWIPLCKLEKRLSFWLGECRLKERQPTVWTVIDQGTEGSGQVFTGSWGLGKLQVTSGYAAQSVSSKEALETIEQIHIYEPTLHSSNWEAWTWQGEGLEAINLFFLRA